MCGGSADSVRQIWGLAALLVIVPIFVWSRRDRLASRRTILELAAILYLDLLLSLTLLSFPLPPYDIYVGDCAFVLLMPFGTIWPAIHTALGSQEWRLLIGNIVAFMPVGVLLPLLRPNLRRPWLTVLAAGFGLSLAIELGQLVGSLLVGFNYRQADVDDVIVNTFGAIAGYALLVGTRGLVRALATGPD